MGTSGKAWRVKIVVEPVLWELEEYGNFLIFPDDEEEFVEDFTTNPYRTLDEAVSAWRYLTEKSVQVDPSYDLLPEEEIEALMEQQEAFEKPEKKKEGE